MRGVVCDECLRARCFFSKELRSLFGAGGHEFDAPMPAMQDCESVDKGLIKATPYTNVTRTRRATTLFDYLSAPLPSKTALNIESLCSSTTRKHCGKGIPNLRNERQV